ncbi:MAG TPA: hypothetical protein VIU65_01385 [Pyrinomonadaceae bacterium]
MNTNGNLAAPLGALALLGTAFLFLVTAIALVQSLVVRRRTRAKVIVLLMLILAGGYLAAMLIFSLSSQEKVLARGQEKHFCELDCHLAYSIVATRQAKQLDGANPLTAQDQFTIITVKTRFDESTISPGRGDGLLYPNGRVVTLIDDSGNRYSPVTQTGTSMTAPLRPGESYTTDVAFELPSSAKPASLTVNESAWDTRLVIGHENSPLHKKTRFQV